MEEKKRGLGTTTRPGWRTTEFWLTLAVVLLAAFVNGGLLEETHWAVKIASLAAAALKGSSYLWSRTRVKEAISGPGASVVVVAFLAPLLLLGCASQASYQRGTAIAVASERTACMAALLACDLAKGEARVIACKAAKRGCLMFPGLLKTWAPIFAPNAKPGAASRPARVSPAKAP